MSWGKMIFWAGLIAVAGSVLAASYYKRFSVEQELSRQASLARQEAVNVHATFVMFSEQIVPRGRRFDGVLQGLGIDSPTAARVAASAARVFDFRRLRAGNRLVIGRSVLGELRALRYRIDAEHILSIESRGSEFDSEVETISSTMETAGVGGEIRGSLFESVTQIGESPELAMRLADIFSYDLDFYTDPRPGDTFRLVVEKKRLSNGETASYGRIFAAEYNNDGRIFGAILFHDPAGRPAYYTAEGKSLKRAFLHSPLKFAALVSSHFSLHRFHPILKTVRPHLGTDYAAPIGTPVQTIADGRVVFAGRKGGSGNLVEIKHSNGYETYYMHLSRMLVRAGQPVEQGQRVGLVGMTGLATGPHLDFRIQRNGTFMDFERLNLPSANPISRREWTEFAASRDHSLALLPDLNALLARNPTPASASVPTPFLNR
jgi:murein DD-endopeptidase MepM/ murein hydrolase activator NlpD